MAHYRGQRGCPVIATVGNETARMASWRGTGPRASASGPEADEFDAWESVRRLDTELKSIR
jgi:hypothetical protein